MRKLTPFSKEQHAEFGKDLKEATDLLSPYLEKLWKAYGVKSKPASKMGRALSILTSELCNEMDNEWYKILDDNDSHMDNPYYGSGIKHYS